MIIGKRFLAWGLVGILVTIGLNGYGGWMSIGVAAEPLGSGAQVSPPPVGTATPPLIAVAAKEENAPWQEGDVESSGADRDAPQTSKRQQMLITADEYYQAGDQARAEVLYRQVKDAQWQVDPAELRPEPIMDAAELSPAGSVYWREAQAGYEKGLTHRIRVPLELLVDEYPEFIPAHVFYANYLLEQEEPQEADTILDRALMIYPSQPELLQARTSTQMALEQWIEAAITARQFALLNPEHPEAEAMDTLSQENMERFRSAMNAELTQNFVGNLLMGAAGAILTGGLIGPYSALNSAMLLLQGETAVGANAAAQIQEQLPMMRDRQVKEYLDSMGQQLATLAGRDEFEYEFYIVDDEDLNAFALPGGKIFINAGAIMAAHSEAEMAGLVAHEISHAVLSHGFQMVTNGNLINSIASMIPIPEVGGIASGLVFSSYSREMERQADILGTQILSAAGYAADGLHNLMVTLEEEHGDRGGIQWFASHPAPAERVSYLQQLVEAGGYNRYAYEGMATHLAMQQRVDTLLGEAETEAE